MKFEEKIKIMHRNPVTSATFNKIDQAIHEAKKKAKRGELTQLDTDFLRSDVGLIEACLMGAIRGMKESIKDAKLNNQEAKRELEKSNLLLESKKPDSRGIISPKTNSFEAGKHSAFYEMLYTPPEIMEKMRTELATLEELSQTIPVLLHRKITEIKNVNNCHGGKN